MAVKTKRISTLIESQLPEFISTEYELFSKFVQKYYEAQEVQGGPLDILSNIQKYADIDYYEKNLLKQNDQLAVSVSDSDTTITLNDATSFPEKNGYVRIGNEIIFYATRTDTQLLECSRGVSGNTTLGDLYDASKFSTTESASHVSGEKVYNVSNLFLYAFVKNFENQYLGSFPEKYLKGDVDKRTLIKNIQKFYKAKGTDSSIKFVFNTIVAKDINNKPSVYKPRDFTYKSSEADWISVYALKVKIVSGDPKSLIGQKVVQTSTDEYDYASATVDNVYQDGTSDGEVIWNIVLAPETVNGEFAVSTKTRLEKDLLDSSGEGSRVNVFSTIGWGSTGQVLIDQELISFEDKNVTQFVISDRGAVPVLHEAGSSVYKPVIISGSGASLLTLGVVYNLAPSDSHPYASVGDKIQVSDPGFKTADPRITLPGTNQSRWVLGTGTSVNIPTIPALQTSLNEVSTNVSAIFEDEQYYYITGSSYPSYKILDGSTVNQELKDQKLLRLLRKRPTVTTEVYQTPKRDVGILVNGVPIYGYKDEESIRFGKLVEIKVDTQGRGYAKPPFVLLDGVPNKARAVLSGQVVESIVVETTSIFPRTPEVTITSGRRAEVRAIVTGGKVTSLVIDNPGEFYSSPPVVRIRDNAGRGRFAEYNAIVDTDGKITGFDKVEEGNFYTQDSVIVDIIPVGQGASGIALLKEWNKNRFTKLNSTLDTNYGYVFRNYNNVLEYGYAHVANPKALRVSLGDNLNSADTEPANKTHSPILGFAYDGNPIYGPFAHQNPLDPQSPIVRMTSSYSLNGSRQDGPSLSQYPLGSFVNDYTYKHKSGSLDQNNGRYCVTPDFPEGTYAYFLTINSSQVPQFPYFVGENFYSLPVDSNYNSNINQNDIPKTAKRFFIPGMPRNGEGVIASISEVQSGTVDNVSVNSSSNNFSVNSSVYFDNQGTGGSEVEAIIESVKGKQVDYLVSKENKVVKLTTIQTAYLFADDTLRQPSSNAYGEIVGTVANDNVIVLKNVSGTFDTTGTFSADIKTFSVLIDQNSSYTEGATLSLTDGLNPPIATAEVLEGTNNQNVVKIKVLTGTWIVDDTYFIQSSNLFNTSGSRIVTLTSLSDGLEPFIVNQSVALIETTENHGLGVGDKVTIDINPDDTTKTKDYYLRKRLYQEVTFAPPENNSSIEDTGVGRFQILNGGADYTAGSYNNIPLIGGSGTGATASITVSSAGVVSSLVLQTKGSGYKKGDYLRVDDESLVRSSASQSTQRLTLFVDHVGFAAGSTILNVASGLGFAEGDLLQVGNEIVEIATINENSLTVLRGIEGTEDIDHYNGQSVSLYKPRYNFNAGFAITSGAGTGYIQSYDLETQKATIIYDYAINLNNANVVQISTSFFDSSVPQRLVAVKTVSSTEYKFEFSEDNVNFAVNPNIDLQEFYRYRFDTSHSSLTNTYFDLSPSKNYNLITLEKTASTILPGNPGSFTEVKFGFGSRLQGNQYTEKVGTNFTNFYYFDKNNIVNSEGKYFKIITDPLQGTKTVNYVTANRFVYDLTATPLWDGSGSISYTTTGQFAIGEINTVKVVNLGLNYKKVPVVQGCDPNVNFRAKATVLFDLTTNTITGVRIDEKGSNYVNPKIVITNGDGVDARFNIVVRGGEIFSITVENPGKGYTFAPEVQIIEGDVKAYVESSTIGVPQSVSITRNGGAFHLDKTVSSKFTSKYVFALSSISGDYQKGEVVVQRVGNTEVARARVAEWRFGSNLLKVENVQGIFRENVSVDGIISNATGVVKSVFVTSFAEDIASFYDNLGYFKSDRGKLGVSNQKLLDSDFYQDYSYVVKSKTPIDQWRDLIKSTTHPAGFKLFGQVDIEATAGTEMPVESPKANHFTVIQLWDPEKNKITVENTRRTVTQTIQKVENQRIRKGVGSASTSEFNFNETRAFEFTLAAPFDGTYNSDGQLVGTTTFQVLDEDGLPFTPVNAKSLIVTLDGVIQEPEVAYTVQADKIIFAQPPLGPGLKQTGEGSTDITYYDGVTFYGKVFYFKDNQYNNRYLKKVRNIFQRNGRWLDSANQIERNKTFIVEESVGYGKFKYPSLDWSTKLDDYSKDIGFILDAYEHDLRFGGNTKTVDYVNIFDNNDEYDYITKNKSESLGIFKYATNLAKLAIRNWDIVEENVNYIQGSTTVTVTDTNRLAVGMHISSGRSFPLGTKITSIDSLTEVTVSSAALANSGGGGGAPAGNTDLDGTTSGDFTLPTSTGSVAPGNTFSVQPGDTLTSPISFSGSDTATFYFSGINTGTFYDASNLINSNKEYLQEEISEYIYDTYSLPQGDKAKCYRDLGYLIDAVVYHLRFGGNEKVVNFAQLYYTNAGYPYGEELTYINRTPEETTAAIDAWNKLGEKMVLAMRNSLGAGTYTAIPPFTDPSVIVDSVSPYCAEVEASITTMIDIVKDIIANGTGVVEIVEINENKSGFWSNTPTYSNYNIIPDPLLTAQECDDVVSSVDSLYDNFESVLNNQAVTKTRPDYVDGENTIFDLYWEDGTEVNTEEDEDLFLTINAVLQRPKYTATYPQEDAYYIDRTVIPNRVVFDVAPIWDQDFGAKTIGEPTAVEKVVGIGVGNYKRLTIDYNLVDGVRSGPFLILDVEDYTVQNIEDSRYLYVFLDGVLQREQYSYTVSGPNIYFNVPIKKEMKIDIRYLYGRDVGQILNVFDFAPDNFYAKGNVSLEVTSGLSNFINYSWMGQYIGSPIHALQIKPDNTYNVIGQISNTFVSGSTLNFEIFGQKSELIDGLDVVFAVSGRYNVSATVSIDYSSSSITYQVDDQGRLLLSDNNQIWSGTLLGKTYKQPFVSLSNNDLIRLEGEEGFRRIKKLPSLTTSKEQRVQQQVSNSLFGTVDVERYNGVTRGEGLSVVAKIENGVVVDLEWNQRSYDPLTQPTAYQYYTPPVLHFIPQDGNGGGAIANVLVSKGQVISVDLIDGGSGYTEAPKVVVSRRYDVLSERDIGVSLINVGINPFLETTGMTAFSSVSVLGNQVSGVNTFTSILFNSPVDSDRVITAEIQLVEQNTELSIAEREFSSTTSANLDDVPVIDVFYDATVLSAQVQDIVSVNSISTVSKAITTTIENLIHNDALSNVNYYAVGAYLDIDLDATDTIVYIPDTAKFKSNGYLLIGNEVVRYYRKLSDRFIMVQRGQDNTTPQFWIAGTFIRQVPDLVSSVFGGVATIQSEIGIVTVKGGIEVGTTERETERQIVSPVNTVTESTTELLRIPPPSGVVDGYVESVFIADPVSTRLNGFVDLDNSYGVIQRNGNEIFVTNLVFGIANEYIGSYERTNAGATLGHFNSIFDDGTANVSAMSLLEMEFHYPALTIRDFEERSKSSYTLSGAYFNLTNPSIQNPVTVSFITGAIGSSLSVQNTAYFPSSGYLFTSGGTVIQYTSKTSSTFDGCTIIRGSSNISVADEIVPFDLT